MAPIMNRLFPLSVVGAVCGRGLASHIVLKTAAGVVSFNNETINTQNMEYVNMYRVQPDTSNNLKFATNHGANALVTPSQGAMKVATNHGANALDTPSWGAMKVATICGAIDSVTVVHRREDQVLPSVKHIHQRIEHNMNSAVEREPSH